MSFSSYLKENSFPNVLETLIYREIILDKLAVIVWGSTLLSVQTWIYHKEISFNVLRTNIVLIIADFPRLFPKC